MSIVKLYIAATLDGYIARPDGNIEWLTSLPAPETGDYGYAALMESVDTIIMGRKTYDELLGFGMEWPYAAYTTFIVSRNAGFAPSTPNTFLLSDNLSARVQELQKRAAKDIWLVGGGDIVKIFMEKDLIDEMIICIVPITLGSGIRLFPEMAKESSWTLQSTQPFNTGLVNLCYKRADTK